MINLARFCSLQLKPLRYPIPSTGKLNARANHITNLFALKLALENSAAFLVSKLLEIGLTFENQSA